MGNSACCEGNQDKGMTTVSTFRTNNAFDEENVAQIEPAAAAEAKATNDDAFARPSQPQTDVEPPGWQRKQVESAVPPAPAPSVAREATPPQVEPEPEEKKQEPPPPPQPEPAVVAPAPAPVEVQQDSGPAEFRVTLDRAGKKLGMVVFNKRNEDFVRVRNVKEDGFIAEWNSKNPNKQIKDGYHILEVNGETLPEKMRDIIGDSKLPTCSFLIRRPN
mmetsp:Transcript_65058/g.121197  ORF Transcript_65058/g.121197 Transcript_65058/m.121197 type:complete len:218 (-) Transcript_65058:81-734(-)